MINNLPERLKNEILEYCKLNSIDNIESFIIKLITQSFTIEKFGENPIFVDKKNRIVEPEVIVKEVVVEKIVEVPVEKIVEKIVEVEVEKPTTIIEETKPSKNEYVINLEPKKENPTPKPVSNNWLLLFFNRFLCSTIVIGILAIAVFPYFSML
jgi:hypothetical protein